MAPARPVTRRSRIPAGPEKWHGQGGSAPHAFYELAASMARCDRTRRSCIPAVPAKIRSCHRTWLHCPICRFYGVRGNSKERGQRDRPSENSRRSRHYGPPVLVCPRLPSCPPDRQGKVILRYPDSYDKSMLRPRLPRKAPTSPLESALAAHQPLHHPTGASSGFCRPPHCRA
jgi:hypothetical protein